MKRLILLVALVMAMAVLAPAAFADEPEAEDPEVEMEEKVPSAAQERKAQMIADYFADDEGGATAEEFADVKAIRAGWPESDESIGHTVGWGVVYKLMLYGFDPADYEGGWAIGQLRKTYLENPDAENLHKNNLGQADKGPKDKPDKSEKTMPRQSNKNGEKHES